jgi:hypothetical protein
MSGAGRHPGRLVRLLGGSDREWSARFGGRRVVYSEEIALLKFIGSRTRRRLPRAGLSLCLAVAVAGSVATLGTGVAQAAAVPGSIGTTDNSVFGWSPVSSVPGSSGAQKVSVSGNGRWVFRIDTAHNVSFAASGGSGFYIPFYPLPGLAGGSSVMQALDISDDTDSAGNLQVFGAKSAYEASLVG